MIWCGAGGLEVGIGVGMVLATLYFAYAYARMHMRQFTVVPTRSGTVRPWDQRVVLDLLCNRVVAVNLSGYIFFGSSLAISDKVIQVSCTPYMCLLCLYFGI